MSHNRKHPRRRTLALVASLFALGAALSGCTDFEQLPFGNQPADSPKPSLSVQTTVLWVTDGDTIVVEPVAGSLEPNTKDGRGHTVRLLGIDAPEMHFYDADAVPDCGAQEALDQLAALLPENTSVVLTFDQNSDHTDRYGRSLAYVAGIQSDDAALAQVSGGWAGAWYPSSEPEPERFAAYEAAQVEAAAVGLGSTSSCETLGRQ